MSQKIEIPENQPGDVNWTKNWKPQLLFQLIPVSKLYVTEFDECKMNFLANLRPYHSQTNNVHRL